MAEFAVFFADQTAIGLERITASDPSTAEVAVRELHPNAQVLAVDSELVSNENRYRLLSDWLMSLSVSPFRI